METNVMINEINKEKPSLFGIITSPTIQFERMKEEASIGLPLVIMILLMGITGSLVSYLSLDNPILNDADLMSDMKIPVALSMGMGAIGGMFGGVIMFFIAAALYKFCMVIMSNDTSYKRLLAVVIYSSIITSLGVLVNTLIALSLGGYEVSYTSMAPLFEDNKMLNAIAQSFDIFKIWYYAVLGIGLHIVTGISKNKAVTLVVIVFLIGVGLSSLGGLIPQPGLK
ncbi:Yip1 family protein [Bacillus sp. 1NLA3E]|uniref:Yip1 family protein n=1 Tax=Bacillus sp. 1NLA3E TaxID=666686 RepID=UPI000247E481|nr:Yip1 family protein [Bacillus sp. 1NLA3E]AGK55970.1 hypothetical protein B1NLA3E_21160 [Bacillus sp. 1NLA3E]